MDIRIVILHTMAHVCRAVGIWKLNSSVEDARYDRLQAGNIDYDQLK